MIKCEGHTIQRLEGNKLLCAIEKTREARHRPIGGIMEEMEEVEGRSKPRAISTAKCFNATQKLEGDDLLSPRYSRRRFK
jgi:hypothetical protein